MDTLNWRGNKTSQGITTSYGSTRYFKSQESVKSELSLELNEKLKGDYIFNDIESRFKEIFINKEENVQKKNEYSDKTSKKYPSYIKVLKIINNYFNNWLFFEFTKMLSS